MDDFYQLFFANSPRMAKVRSVIEEIARADANVLVRGESGTGKEVVARAIHLSSDRVENPFVKVNCAAIPRGLLESELFGFEKGAFTGAHQKKPGKFELAHGGTIVLNDIEEMDISLQSKLLQVLQDGAFPRLGGDQDVFVNSRVISTTKDLLEKLIRERKFREDLYFRIGVMNIIVPPLRERKEQIIPFSQFFLGLYKKKYRKANATLSQKATRALRDYEWPGNIRELENVTKRIVLFGEEDVLKGLADGGLKKGENLGSPERESSFAKDDGEDSFSLKRVGKRAAEEAEREFIRSTLEVTKWNRKEAAALLRISYKALLYKIQRYGLVESKEEGKVLKAQGSFQSHRGRR